MTPTPTKEPTKMPTSPYLNKYINEQLAKDDERLRVGLRPEVEEDMAGKYPDLNFEAPPIGESSNFDVGVSASTATAPVQLPSPSKNEPGIQLDSPFAMGSGQDSEYRQQFGLTPANPEINPVEPKPFQPKPAQKPQFQPPTPEIEAPKADDPTQEGMTPQQKALDDAATQLNADIARADKNNVPQLIAAAFAGLGDALVARGGGQSDFLGESMKARGDRRGALDRRRELLTGRQDAERTAEGKRTLETSRYKATTEAARLKEAKDERRYQETKGFKDRAEALKGEALERDLAETEKMAKLRRKGALAKAENIIGVVDKAISQVGITTTGEGGRAAEYVPFLRQKKIDLENSVNTLKANLAFKTLQEMREASKTGGALGQVSERELALLESALAALNTDQSRSQMLENLQKVKTHYQNAIDALNQIEAEGDTPLGEGGDQNVPGGTIDESKELNGKTYTKINGQWYEQ